MKKKIIILLSILVFIVPAALYLLGYIPIGEIAEGEVAEEVSEVDEYGEPILPEGDSLYLPLNPPFVVNFTHLGTLRYLQVSLEVMYYDQDLLDRVTAKMPAIRNALILLLSNQEYERLSTLSGKEEIREEIKMAVNDIILLDEEVDHTGEIYITNFVMQ